MPVPEEVLGYCSSLVIMTIRFEKNYKLELECVKELSLAHFSVKEYLISDRFQQDDRMKDVRLDFLETNARASIVKVCVTYLLGLEALINTNQGADIDEYYNRMLSEGGQMTFRRDYPMAQYSAQYWPEHARLANDIGEVKSLIWDLMKSAAYKMNWSLHDNSTVFPPTLYYASGVGLSWLVEGLLEDGADVKAEGDDGTALNVAADCGHDDIVRLLLQAGADADARNKYGEAPLHTATSRGSGRIVQWLLEYSTDINATSTSGTPLWIATQKGHVEIVRCLLEHGADCNAAYRCNGDGMTLLQEAARRGHVEVIEQLVKHGADINAASLDGTALRWAVRHGNCTIVELLINHGADLDLAGRRGGTPLQAAVHQSHGKIVQCLLEHGADADLASEDQIAPDRSSIKIGFKRRPNADRFNQRNTPLYLAASRGSGKIVQQLVEHGADVNAISTSQGSDETALEGALAGGHIEIAQQLIEHGANVNAKSKRHGSALCQAAAKGLGHIVEQLLDLGADPNVAGALHEAVKGGHAGIIQQLIDRGADIDSHSEAHRGTPLCAAVYATRGEIVGLLLQNGANVNGTELTYGFALHKAAMDGHGTIFQQLIDQGADVNVTGYDDDRTALQAAVYNGRHDVVLQLLQHGAKVNATGNRFDLPALIIAATQGYSEIVRQLLEYDADIDAIGWVHGTALHAAVSHGHSETVQLLLDRGVDVSIIANPYGTALQVAILHGHDDIVKQLREHEANLASARVGHPSTGLSIDGKLFPFQ